MYGQRWSRTVVASVPLSRVRTFAGESLPCVAAVAARASVAAGHVGVATWCHYREIRRRCRHIGTTLQASLVVQAVHTPPSTRPAALTVTFSVGSNRPTQQTNSALCSPTLYILVLIVTPLYILVWLSFSRTVRIVSYYI